MRFIDKTTIRFAINNDDDDDADDERICKAQFKQFFSAPPSPKWPRPSDVVKTRINKTKTKTLEFQDQEQDQDSMFQDQDFVAQDQDQDQDSGSRLKLNDKDVLIKKNK